MPRPLALPTLVVVLVATLGGSTFGPTALVLPAAGDEPIRDTATVPPAARVACCGGDEVDAAPERREQTLTVRNDPSESSANTSGGPPVDLVGTVANRNPNVGGPDTQRKWHVWVTKRNDSPTPDRFEKIVVHVEPYAVGDCGEGSGGSRQCATATIWLYDALTSGGPQDYKLKLEERYRKIDLTIVKSTGPTRGLAFRAEHPLTDELGNEDETKNRVFLITGARKGNGNNRNHRSLRVTTFVKPSGSSKAASAGDAVKTNLTECIDYVDDAYYEEEDYSGEYAYPDPADSPYEDEPYDYEA